MAYARPDMPIVEVVWVDSNHLNGWHNLRTLDEDTSGEMECRSVGYLFRSDADCVTLVMGVSETGMFDSSLTIPRVAVLSMTTLLERQP